MSNNFVDEYKILRVTIILDFFAIFCRFILSANKNKKDTDIQRLDVNVSLKSDNTKWQKIDFLFDKIDWFNMRYKNYIYI